ncbi:MAG: hypothetical protein U0167_00075 [bacterium]
MTSGSNTNPPAPTLPQKPPPPSMGCWKTLVPVLSKIAMAPLVV